MTKWRNGFIDNATPSDINTFPMVLFGNKADKDDKQINDEEVQKWTRENNGMSHYETSALNNQNVDDAFMCMVQKALER